VSRFATESQLLLLRAALVKGPDGIQAANTWIDGCRDQIDDAFAAVEPACRRLLPLVHRNVEDGIEANVRKQLRAAYHQYWAQNRRLFHQLEATLQRLEARRVPTLVLKGVPLSILHYRDLGTRPMSDFDVLVPEAFAPALVREHVNEGWTSCYWSATAPSVNYFYRFRHAVNLSHPKRGSFDLHWHALLDATYPGADDLFWEGSLPLLVNSSWTRALNPTDQLLHTCIHGYPFAEFPPIRWIADAITILRTSRIDWKRLCRVAVELRLSTPCAETLEFLNEAFAAGVPSDVISTLARQPVEAAERRFFQHMADPAKRRWWETLQDVWTAVGRSNRNSHPLKRLSAFPRHLQFEQGLSSPLSLFPHTLVFLRRRMTEQL